MFDLLSATENVLFPITEGAQTHGGGRGPNGEGFTVRAAVVRLGVDLARRACTAVITTRNIGRLGAP
jgi:hypothetical protein